METHQQPLIPNKRLFSYFSIQANIFMQVYVFVFQHKNVHIDGLFAKDKLSTPGHTHFFPLCVCVYECRLSKPHSCFQAQGE